MSMAQALQVLLKQNTYDWIIILRTYDWNIMRMAETLYIYMAEKSVS